MVAAHPYLGLAASVLYAGTAFTCGLAANSSHSVRNRKFWWASAAFFLALAAVRSTGLEALATENLRQWLHDQGAYGDRRILQRPIAACAVVVLSAALFVFWSKRPAVRASPRQWAKFWATVGIVIMSGVIGMRLISFHDLDSLLYGPIKLNWLLDVGSSALVAWAAWRFRRSSGAGLDDLSHPNVTPANRRGQ